MSHRHFCGVAEPHWWECDGEAMRLGEEQPSVCLCDGCHLSLEQGGHGPQGGLLRQGRQLPACRWRRGGHHRHGCEGCRKMG